MDALDYLSSVGGVARVGVLRAHGHTPSAIRKLALAGAHQPRKGVWALPSADPDYLTAILSNGHVTCASAALRYGLWIKEKPMRVHLATRHCRGKGFVRHGSLRLPPETAVPLASLEDTVIHALTCLPDVDAISIAQSAMQQFGIPQAMIESEISADYYGNARRLLAKADGLSESVPEISARLLFESEGLPFRRQVQIQGVGRVDFLIGRRLIVEVNGYAFHSSREAWRKDMARLNAAQARGFDVLSFAPEKIWNNPEQVMEEIRAVLAQDSALK